MRFGYGLSRLLGSVYGNGNVVFLPPDGTCILSPVRNRVLLIDLVNHSSSVLPFESRKEIRLLTPSHDGRLLLVLDVDGRALLVNLQRRVVLHRFNFKKKIRAISFSPDDRFIAAGVGKKVEVWRTPGRRHQIAPLSLLRAYGGLQDDVTCLAWGPDSRHLVAGSKDATARVFFVNDTGEEAAFVPTTLAGHREGLRGCFVSATGDEVYTVAKDGGVFVWEWVADNIGGGGGGGGGGGRGNGSVTAARSAAMSRKAAAAAEQKRIESKGPGGPSGADGGGMEQEEEEEKEEEEVERSSDGEGNSGSSEEEDEEEEQEEQRRGDLGKLRTPANGKWRLVSKHFLRPGGSCNITSASFHAKRSLLVLGFSHGVFGLYEMPDCTAIHTLSVGQAGIGTCDVSATGDWLAFGCARLGQLLVWEWQSETYVLKQQGHGYGLNCAAFGATGSVCATGGDDSKVKLWSTTSGFCFVTFSEHEAPVTAVRFTPNASAVVSASLDGTVRAHDLVRYKNFRTLVTPQPAQLTSLALDGSGEVVVAGAMDPFEVYVWSLQTGRLLDVLAGHEAPLSELCFSPSQGVLASASWDGTVKLWDVYKSECIETLEMPADVLAVSFRPDGRQLCCACLNGTLQLWGTDGGDLQGIIEGRRDIAGGRRAHDMVTAANSNHGKYFTSVDYTADGTCVVAAGQSKFVCIYECSQQILVKKFQISHNRSLDGVLDELHNKRLMEAGSLDMLEGSDSEEEGRYRGANLALPGAEKGADGSSRRTREEARSTCVRFSPTGREWAACTTDGLLLYSLDEAAVFDPSDLDESVTPEAVHDAIGRKEWAKAVLMSLHLNERELREKAVDAVPLSEVDLTATSLPAPYALRLLGVLADRLAHSPRLEFHLTWSLSTLQSHGGFLRGLAASDSRAAGVMRTLQRALTSHQADLFKLCQDNQYTLSFLGAIDDAKDKDAVSGETSADAVPANGSTSAAGPLAKRMRVP